MAPFLVPIVSMLAEKGLNLLSNAVDKGSDKAIEFISDKTGIDLMSKQELSTEDMRVLRELEISNKMELQRMAYQDRADARDMQKEALKQDDKFSKRFVYYLATFWSITGLVYIFLITFGTIPEQNVRFADTILGFLLGTIVSTIINYFFGSSTDKGVTNANI